MTTINFFQESIVYVPRNKTQLREWLTRCAAAEKKKIGELNYIFCSDPYLRKLNKKYLGHDYFTDIITFPSNMDDGKVLGGDIFISIPRVKMNAKAYGVPFSTELKRVLAHGMLHLCGYNDHTDEEIKTMRKKEDRCLAIKP
jgi:probable rRNA maturation factor